MRFLNYNTMKLVIIFLILFLLKDTAYSREYKIRKKTGNYWVEIKISRNPPIVDKNILTLEIRDSNNKNIIDARVMVNYYMPPMPGMAPMNYKTYARLSGHKYEAVMNLIMSGPWNIVLRITRPQETFSVRFAIDVQ